MIARYVFKSFSRHKARTVIMVLALLVVSAMLVTLNNGVESLQRQVVELVESEAGEHDITLTRSETSANQFIDVAQVTALLQSTDPQIKAIYPRFMGTVELHGGQQPGNASLLARMPDEDLGQVKMLEGEYNLEGDRVVVLKVTADTFGLKVGDEIVLSYIMPLARIKGYAAAENDSTSRITRRFTISGIALATAMGGGMQNGVLANVATVQDWLSLPGRAERLVVVLDKQVYGSVNTQTAIFRVRRIAERLYDALDHAPGSIGGGEAYVIALQKAQMLDSSDIAFAVMRSISTVYGFLVMGVVGLLIYSLINTNVEERRRDLAFLRIMGARRYHLFMLVMIEVAIIGSIGVGLGCLGGQAFSYFVVSPIANMLIANAGSDLGEMGITFKMTITLNSMLWTGMIATVVLFASALAPANKAANTKVRYAINPGSADNLQIEDLTRLRSRRFDVRIVIAGIVLTIMWLLIFIGNNFLYAQGNESVVSIFMFGGMVLLVIGVSLLFYALTIPFEKILILISGMIAPRLTFFAAPNLVRSKQRNTVISLMVVFSATLPTFLGTMMALEQRNYDTDVRYNNGAPIIIQISRWRWSYFDESTQNNLKPNFLERVYAIEGIERGVGLTTQFSADVTNKVELRKTAIQVQGITGSLDGIVYPDLTQYAAGGPQSFEQVLVEPDTIILSAAYADYMDLKVGDLIRVPGEGKDHFAWMRIVGLLDKFPGIEGVSSNQNFVRWGMSPGLVSLDTYLRLTNDPLTNPVCVRGACSDAERDQPIISSILATVKPDADATQVVADLRELLADRPEVWIQSTAEDIRTTEQSMRTTRVLMLIMTSISFITSIFGVFAVVYMAVYVRRTEIGMLKAIGMPRRQLVGIFALESVMMTVSASLAGVTAGTALGYVFYTSNNVMRSLPVKLTFDWLTTLAILVMVVVASVISASWAARSTVRRKVTQILREAL